MVGGRLPGQAHRHPYGLERGRGDALSVLGADDGKGVRGIQERLLIVQAVVGLQQFIDAAAPRRQVSEQAPSGTRPPAAR